MDSAVLLEVFSLGIFIAGFQPLVRRVGAYANLWFVGWSFLLVHEVVLSLAGANGFGGATGLTSFGLNWSVRLISALAVAGCGLAFVAAAANSSAPPGSPISNDRQMNPLIMVEITVPVLLQTAVSVLKPNPDRLGVLLQIMASALFMVPLIQMLLTHERRRSLLRVGAALAIFGPGSFWFVLHDPGAVLSATLCLLFWCAAYLYSRSAPVFSRGRIAALTGLILSGATYPIRHALMHLAPGLHVERVLFQMPQYLVVAGVSLALLEEHVLRTEHMANYDPLTDLPNRRLFEERLIATMEEAHEQKTTIACLVIDVDNFKTINDTLGHSAGDQLLRQLAVRLSWHIGPRDILARTGGDEFTALLAGVTDEHHLRFIASAMMSAASVPIIIDSGPVDVRISVGIALSPDHADDIDSLRRAADEAMYTAKRRGGSMLAFAGEE